MELNYPPLEYGLDLVTISQGMGYARSERAYLLRLGHKRHCSFLLALGLGSLTLEGKPAAVL